MTVLVKSMGGRMRVAVAILAAVLLASCSLAPAPRPAPPRVPPPAPQPAPVPPEEREPAPPMPEPPPRPLPRTPSAPAVRDHTLTPAAKALTVHAQQQAASGDFPVAVATLERALRIEPANPLLWIELGKVHQASGNYAQAESTARKALSVSSSDLKAQSAAWQLIAQSLRARGRAPEAQQAAARAWALLPD